MFVVPIVPISWVSMGRFEQFFQLYFTTMCEMNILIVTFDVRCSIMYILTQLDCLATICFLFVFSLPVRENQIKLKPEEVQKHENLQTLRFALFLHTLVLYLDYITRRKHLYTII